MKPTKKTQKAPSPPSLKPKRKKKEEDASKPTVNRKEQVKTSYLDDLFGSPQGKMKKDYGKPKGKR